MQNNLNYSTNVVRVDLTKVTDGGLNLNGNSGKHEKSSESGYIFMYRKKIKSCMTENMRTVTADCTGSNSMSEISCVNNTSNGSKYYIPVSLGENKQSSRSTTA